MTRGHFHVFRLPEYGIHQLDNDFERFLLPNISWGIFVFSFAFVVDEREEGNALISTAATITLNKFPRFPTQLISTCALTTFNARNKVRILLRVYATVEISNVCFFCARFTYVNVYATVEMEKCKPDVKMCKRRKISERWMNLRASVILQNNLSRYAKIVIRAKGPRIRCLPLGGGGKLCIFFCKKLQIEDLRGRFLKQWSWFPCAFVGIKIYNW